MGRPRGRGRVTLLLVAAASLGILLAGLAGLWLFRTVPLTTDPVTWIEINAVKLGSGFSSGEAYGRPPTEVLYKFGREVPVEVRPSSIPATPCDPSGTICQGSMSFSPTSWSVTPIRRETVEAVVRGGYSTVTASLYAFSMDVDAARAGLPDLSAIVIYVGREGNTYYYNVQTIVSGAPPIYPNPGEHRSRWLNTYMVFRLDPWFKPLSFRIDGVEVVPPSDPCLARGDCKFILPVASQAPDAPIASGYTLLERLYPHTAGEKSIVKVHLVEIVVDPYVSVATAPTTLVGQTYTATGVTTITVPATKTVVVTERQTVTRTYTVSSYLAMYATTTVVEGRTYTTTVIRTVTAPQTLIAEGPTRTLVTTVVRPGETVTLTRTYLTTVTETQPILDRDLLTIMIGAGVFLAIVVTVILAAMALAGRARAAPPRRGPGRPRRPGRRR